MTDLPQEKSSGSIARRSVLRSCLATAAAVAIPLPRLSVASVFSGSRPISADRRFVSPAIEDAIQSVKQCIADPQLAAIFEQCFPNTLDTTVFAGTFEGKPDTYIITGDIDAMCLRDSSAQVWPYLRFAKQDARLKEMLEGVVRRHARMITCDSYANAFRRNVSDPALPWAVDDKTEMKPGVAERKWEIDSLCYPVRLAHGYWRHTGDASPYDAAWRAAAARIVETFKDQQRINDPGPYSFARRTSASTDTLPLHAYGNPARPVGIIFSMFRPSDDACIFPLFVPANLFAIRALEQIAELAENAANDPKLAADCNKLIAQVRKATQRYGIVTHPEFGQIWAYEVDGYGNALMMDDSNAPGLLALPYLDCCPAKDPLYQRTRRFALSASNPYFFQGKAAEGLGSPHSGLGQIWPIGIMLRALTSSDDMEILACLRWLRNTTAGTGFMHESFDKDNPKKFTRGWFAWANTLLGELILHVADTRPALLKESMEPYPVTG